MVTTEVLKNELQTLRKDIDVFYSENISFYNELFNQNKALRDEIISLRQENIELHKELASQHQVLLNAINFFIGQNLKNHLTRLSGMQTAQFIINNMNKVKSFDDRANYLKYVLNHIENSLGGSIWNSEFSAARP